MTEPAYPAARTIAATVEAHFAHLHSTLHPSGGEDPAPLPDAKSIEAIINTAFWASLRREEGHDPKISLAFLPPELSQQSVPFDKRLPLAAPLLSRLAPAVERPGIHVGVWRFEGRLEVWGIIRVLPSFCFVLEVVEPGLLVVKYRRGELYGKFGNVAVLDGDDIKFVNEEGAGIWDYPALLTPILSLGSPTTDGASNELIQLAASIRAHRRGGALLIVPGGTDTWRDSIVWPIQYLLKARTTTLAEILRQDAASRDELAWQNALRRAVEAVAGLTAVDGATIITDQYELLAFGAKITRADGSTPVEQVVATEAVVGSVPTVVHPTRIGGTRHLSAAQFVHDQHDALAMVASQDGRFTLYAWSAREGMVHAHRIETLLL